MSKQNVSLILCSLLAVGLGLLARVARAEINTTLTITTANDVVDGSDGLCSLREAVIAANSNAPSGMAAGECAAGSDDEADVIMLGDGQTYLLSIAKVDEDEAEGGDLDVLDNSAETDIQFVVANNGTATIDANSIDRALHLIDASVALTGISITRGKATGNAEFGGGIFSESGQLMMTNGSVTHSSAVLGGGIAQSNSGIGEVQTSLNNVTLSQNTAEAGGGFFGGGKGKVAITMHKTFITNNQSTGRGGGLYIQDTLLDMTNSVVNNNTAGSDCGGMCFAVESGAPIITIADSQIHTNQAMGVGGGVSIQHDLSFTIKRSTVSNNTAAGDGGGIYSVKDIQIEHTDFSNNISGEKGGAVRAAKAHIIAGTFDKNEAADWGGAVYTSLTLESSGTAFTNNSASHGGAIRTQFLDASNILVENNAAKQDGGGLNISNLITKLDDSQVISNTAGGDGGGVHFGTLGLLKFESEMSQTVIANNKAAGDGGGIWVNKRLIVGNSTISSNGAQHSGGGLYIGMTAFVTGTNATVAYNMQGQDVYKMGEMTLQNSIIHTPDMPNCNLIATPIVSLGNNITDDASCSGLTQPSDQQADALLAPLKRFNHTWAHPLLNGSPAIDKGNAAVCASSLINGVDQRGMRRIVGSSCDIGAFEKGSIVFIPIVMRE